MQSALPSSLPLSRPSTSIATTLPGRIVLAVAATALVALCAHITLPLPFTLVPLTLQTFAVVLVGMLLGPIAGFASMVLYLAEGASGMPVFSPHGPGGVAQLLGPTAGYLFSYPLVALISGILTRTQLPALSTFSKALLAGTIASLPVFLMGAGWYAHLLHLSAATTWHLAVAPFIPGEIVKVTAAAGIFSSFQRWRRSHN